jgi:integrase
LPRNLFAIVNRSARAYTHECGEQCGEQEMKRLSGEDIREETKPGRYADGGGLFLEIRRTKAGTLSRSWTLRFQLNDKRRDMGLGSFPTVTLTEARRKANEARVSIGRGIDPLDARDADRANAARKPIPTFGDIAHMVIADAQAKSTNAKVRYQWERHLGQAYSGPLLTRPVNEITTVEVAKVLKPIWRAKPEVARKVYPAVRRVFDRARVILRDDHGVDMVGNPADWTDLKALGFGAPEQLSRGRHPSLPYAHIADFMADLRSRDALTARALEFLILTGVRTDFVLKATWEQFDLDSAVWTVPLSSLKDRSHRSEGFRVPLSARGAEIVRDMDTTRISRFVFPGYQPNQPLSNMALLILMRRMCGTKGADALDPPKWADPATGKMITPHGFRATLKTWALETQGFPHTVVETALGHQVSNNDVERAYIRTDLLDGRRRMMDAWAAYCDGQRRPPT